MINKVKKKKTNCKEKQTKEKIHSYAYNHFFMFFWYSQTFCSWV